MFKIFTNLANNFHSDIMKQKHCIFLHGWDLEQNMSFFKSSLSPEDQLAPIEKVLMPTLRRYNWTSHRILYPTQIKFSETSFLLNTFLTKSTAAQKFNFQNTIFITYSTGGLVARHLVSELGFNFNHLITIATPHCGISNKVNFFKLIPSIRPLLQDSKKINFLNTNPTDINNRENYSFFGVTYKKRGKTFQDDGLIPITSSLGSKLKNINIKKPISISIHKERGFLPLVHNKEVLNPSYISPFINHCIKTLTPLNMGVWKG